jgi:hypothetical protein
MLQDHMSVVVAAAAEAHGPGRNCFPAPSEHPLAVDSSRQGLEIEVVYSPWTIVGMEESPFEKATFSLLKQPQPQPQPEQTATTEFSPQAPVAIAVEGLEAYRMLSQLLWTHPTWLGKSVILVAVRKSSPLAQIPALDP